MTDRREFVGAMLALFTGLAVPRPAREVIQVVDPCLESFLAMVDGHQRMFRLFTTVAVTPELLAMMKPDRGAFERQALHFAVK